VIVGFFVSGCMRIVGRVDYVYSWFDIDTQRSEPTNTPIIPSFY
jgi:hypothetical protein